MECDWCHQDITEDERKLIQISPAVTDDDGAILEVLNPNRFFHMKCWRERQALINKTKSGLNDKEEEA